MWPGARVWQDATVWAVCFPCNSAVYHQGQKTAICNLQGLVTDGVSFKLVNGGLQKIKCGYCTLQEKSGFLSNCRLAKFK